MPMYAMESYTPLAIAADADVSISTQACYVGGFTCVVTGTLTLRRENAAGAIVVDALPVTAGNYHPLPYSMPTGAFVELNGGAKGTIAWNP